MRDRDCVCVVLCAVGLTVTLQSAVTMWVINTCLPSTDGVDGVTLVAVSEGASSSLMSHDGVSSSLMSHDGVSSSLMSHDGVSSSLMSHDSVSSSLVTCVSGL